MTPGMMISYHAVTFSTRLPPFKPLGLGNPLTYDEIYAVTAMGHSDAPRHARGRGVVWALKDGNEHQHWK